METRETRDARHKIAGRIEMLVTMPLIVLMAIGLVTVVILSGMGWDIGHPIMQHLVFASAMAGGAVPIICFGAGVLGYSGHGGC